MHLYESPTDEEILAFIENWIDDLAHGNYEAAFSRTDHDPYYSWTPNLIRTVIENYGSPTSRPDGKIFRVTDWRKTNGIQRERTVERENIPSSMIAEVRYDLPLNGEWSDLTATFRIECHRESSVVILQEIHVF